jgi:uncharacterized protein
VPLIRAEFILYVADQRRSAAFYSAVLGLAPTLDVPGMTEFPLPGEALLGLMPASSIERLLPQVLTGASGAEPTRAELYLIVDEVEPYYRRALEAGGRALSEAADREWGHRVSYVLDPDGHVVAFAQQGATVS